MKLLYTSLSLTLLTFVSTGKADVVLVENTTSTTDVLNVFGQSFTTPDDGTSDILTGFNWLENGNPTGSGTAYLFTSAYIGAPRTLGHVAALASATWNSTTQVYDFSLADITLQPDTKYYIYASALSTVSINASGIDVFSGGDAYQATTASHNFALLANEDTTFQVFTKDPSPTPEPGTLALAGVAGVGALFYARRRK